MAPGQNLTLAGRCVFNDLRNREFSPVPTGASQRHLFVTVSVTTDGTIAVPKHL